MVSKQCADCLWCDICPAKRRCAHYSPLDERRIQRLDEKQIELERIDFYREWFDYDRRSYE